MVLDSSLQIFKCFILRILRLRQLGHKYFPDLQFSCNLILLSFSTKKFKSQSFMSWDFVAFKMGFPSPKLHEHFPISFKYFRVLRCLRLGLFWRAGGKGTYGTRRGISLFSPVEIPRILALFIEHLFGGSDYELRSWAVSARKRLHPSPALGLQGCHLSSASQSFHLGNGNTTSTCFSGCPED